MYTDTYLNRYRYGYRRFKLTLELQVQFLFERIVTNETTRTERLVL